MTARVRINPNLRLDVIYTMADLDEDVTGDLPSDVFESVFVYEPESGLSGTGWVTNVDQAERTVTLMIDWATLELPQQESATTAINGVLGMVTNRGFCIGGANRTVKGLGRFNMSHDLKA